MQGEFTIIKSEFQIWVIAFKRETFWLNISKKRAKKSAKNRFPPKHYIKMLFHNECSYFLLLLLVLYGCYQLSTTLKTNTIFNDHFVFISQHQNNIQISALPFTSLSHRPSHVGPQFSIALALANEFKRQLLKHL